MSRKVRNAPKTVRKLTKPRDTWRDQLWRCRDGQQIPLRHLTASHLLNIIHMLERNDELQVLSEPDDEWGFGDPGRYVSGSDSPIYQSLVREAALRGVRRVRR